MKVSLKRWRLGLRIAALDGVCSGVVCLVTEMNWKQSLAVVTLSLANSIRQFIRENPVAEIEETQIINKP